MNLMYFVMLALLVFGFGFVIFWHELGHFLAAKWAGVKVDQFAVGFGQAAIAWRKGIGFRIGSTANEYERRVEEKLKAQEASRIQFGEKLNRQNANFERAADELGLGETEYRLNWIPLGGYVKMVGQDDLDPNARSESPRAFNNRPIYKRMIIVSAGVVMNMVLAVILFTVLFRIGFHVPPPLVGATIPGSPAQQAGLQPGDRIESIDGSETHDFNKLMMSIALLEGGQSVPVVVSDPQGTRRTVSLAPGRTPDDPKFLKIGVMPAFELRGPDTKTLPPGWQEETKLSRAESNVVAPGDTITAIDGVAVDDPKHGYLLEKAAQESHGSPIDLTIRDSAGAERHASVQPIFLDRFNGDSANFAGLAPRSQIEMLTKHSSAIGKLQPGDQIVAFSTSNGSDWQPAPSPHGLSKALHAVGENGGKVGMMVERDGKQLPPISDLTTQVKLEGGGRGLGISLGYDLNHPVVGEVLANTSAAKAQVPVGATITAIQGKPVSNWFDVYNAVRDSTGALTLTAKVGESSKDYKLDISDAERAEAASSGLAVNLALQPLNEVLKTTNPLIAAKWGVAETRDLTLQFYLMLKRMTQGSVSPKNAIGPYGIFKYGSAFAQRGIDWLIWFLAMISANLAVVNFLPIPIVDGGLFIFLVLEKVMGRPLSARAQGVAQIVGLCLIGTVFLFVTYNDITR